MVADKRAAQSGKLDDPLGSWRLIGALGDEAVAAFRAVERVPKRAAHVRSMAYQYEQARSRPQRFWPGSPPSTRTPT
ncbi:hypothetical protein JCM33774_71060 [Actinophytocola sp. KF-1]